MINGCPASFKVLADRNKVSFTRVERCTVGHLTELQVRTCMSHFMRKRTLALVFCDPSNACAQPLRNEPLHEKNCLCHMQTTKAQISLHIQSFKTVARFHS